MMDKLQWKIIDSCSIQRSGIIRKSMQAHETGKQRSSPFGVIVAAKGNLVTIESEYPMRRNEVAFVHVGAQRLKAEILTIRKNSARLQVYENTSGIRVGQRVDLTGEMLSVTLGPGLLGNVFDGLQNPLAALAKGSDYYLHRGVYVDALDPDKLWNFEPLARAGQTIRCGDVLGTVQEGRLQHRILAPFDLAGQARLEWIEKGMFTVSQPIASLRRADGSVSHQTMSRRAAVRIPLSQAIAGAGQMQRVLPDTPLVTTIRIIDSFFPVARGGTACIPGPFGAGKTVLQNLIAKYSNVDVVILIACGERAGEVVEVITEFPKLTDPYTGGSLMDRTIIIANTSSMPVAARESSIYTGVTMGEYYRQLGYAVLVIADSTSRWAQALRETSANMEEIPGDEAYPAYLDSTIKRFYERAGVITTPDGRTGSLTIIGTVSPAGGNFDEPVTQATLGTVKTFLGLSAALAHRRCYPSIDPAVSWSRYHSQLDEWFATNLDLRWRSRIDACRQLLARGDEINRLMQVAGEDGIAIGDYVLWLKANLLALTYLQQDAYDAVDVSTSLERQNILLAMLHAIIEKNFHFETREQASDFFTRLSWLFKNQNYSRQDSAGYKSICEQIEQHCNSVSTEPVRLKPVVPD